MSPYIVTTKTPAVLGPHALSERVLSRRAVATLDEAREQMAQAAHEQGAFGIQLSAGDLPEQAGTVTLPDGTVIEVEPRTIKQMLVHDLNYAPWRPQDEASILAAFNEAQGGPR